MIIRRLLPIAAAAALCAGAPAVFAEEIVVSAQLPLTGSQASFAGQNQKVAAEIAAERINGEHLIGPNRTLRLIVDDDASDKTQAISLTSKSANTDNAIAILGPNGSYLSLAAAPVANSLQIPMVTFAVSTGVTKAGPWTFKMLNEPIVPMTIIGNLISSRLKAKKLAIVYDRTNDASVNATHELTELMKDAGVEVVSADSTAPQDSNFAPLASKLSSESFDTLWLEQLPPVSANILIQLRQAGMSPDIRVVGSQQMGSPTFLRIAGKAAEGVYYPVDYYSGLDTPENKAFVAAYRDRMHQRPNSVAAAAYAGLMIIAEAAKEAGPDADRQKVRDAMAKIRNLPTIWAQGTFSFTDNRAATYQLPIVRITEGEEVMMK